MKIHFNPIVKKDLQVTARSMRISWGLFAYEGVLTLTFLLALLIIQEETDSFYNTGNVYSYLVYLFPVVAIAQVCIVALIMPIITSSSISGEKERQTFDIMLTTCMSPFSIVAGKVFSAVLRILFFVAGSLPIMGLSFVVGGLRWSSLFYYLLSIVLLSVFCGSIGILCSAFCRKSIAAVILSFVIYFVVYGGSFLPLLLMSIWGKGNVGEAMLPLLFNPIVFFEEMFCFIMMGESIISAADLKLTDVGYVTYYLAKGKVWMFVSVGCILLLSLLFMLLAAWKVNPMHSSGGRRPRKKKEE